ncbi:hypothetical protein LEP1GSC037_3714 [Leptospira interrogans str. 2006001854]|uniref:Dolichyl-phosphate-mannose-protein mannosyltransferase n=1 Tax=Leptospira interrogans str. 2006001854 TaxID=1001590 RepID=M6GRE1_LEPIR|nr:hypothetical protein LEP1GSC037_3714 [Leptospira interrogans str. 2006001854]
MTWDENIRLNVVLDQYQDFREFRIWRAFFPFLESPTWPPLRSLFSLILLIIPGDMSITEKDSLLGLIFYGLCFPSILYIVYKITGSLWKAGLTSILTLALTLHTTETPSYSLSSMLETQGMFFLLWTYYTLYKVYSFTYPDSFRYPFEKKKKSNCPFSFLFLVCFLPNIHTDFYYSLQFSSTNSFQKTKNIIIF